MDLNGDQPPFWAQPTTTSSAMSRRRPSTPLLSLPILIIILPVVALLLLFVAIPPFLTVTSQILRPHHGFTVKKSWDSLNIFLVLFAIICGVFARRNDDGSTTEENYGRNDAVNSVSNIDADKNHQPQLANWCDPYSDRKIYDSSVSFAPAIGGNRLRRSSSSYPDLKQLSSVEAGDDRFRYFDDFDLQNKLRPPALENHVRLRRTITDLDESEVKVIPVDTFVLRPPTQPPPPVSPFPNPTLPPPPPPPPTVHRKPRRTYQNVGRKDRTRSRDVDILKFKPQPPPPPPRPPPPPPAPVKVEYGSEQKHVKLERKKSNATKEIKLVFTSLYNQRKRKKKQKTKYTDEYVKSFNSPSEPPPYSTVPPPSPPPPPPPPPLPPSVFHNLFKKSIKSKKIHSVRPPVPPPPPPAPPSSSRRKVQAPPPPPPAPPTPPTQYSRRKNATTSGRPPLPAGHNYNNFYDDQNVNSGNQSPLIPMPPPPPPPFRMPEFRFVVRGDFISIRSENSSRCTSPELEEETDLGMPSTNEPTGQKVNVMNGGDEVGVGSVFCPSPDVNVKADTFIARLRDGWRLEKINSLKEKRKLG